MGKKVEEKKVVESVGDVLARIAKEPVVVARRAAAEIVAVDLSKVDIAGFKQTHPSSNSGLIALLKSKPCTRHELLGFLLEVYYAKGEIKRATARLNGFLGNKSPRKGCYVEKEGNTYTVA